MSRSSERGGASSPQPEPEARLGRRRHNSQEGECSSSGSKSLRPESHDDNEGRVWPEPFVEAVAQKVAIAAAQGGGALAAAPALVAVFQIIIYLFGTYALEEAIKDKQIECISLTPFHYCGILTCYLAFSILEELLLFTFMKEPFYVHGHDYSPLELIIC